jgi:hypothetical protein
MNYILDVDGRTPKPEPNILKWAMWFETADRTVRRTALKRGDPPEEYCVVSTVFLGLDHNFRGVGPPVLFETMVFADGSDAFNIQQRCVTWADAERQHIEVCNEVERIVSGAPIARSWRKLDVHPN